MNPYYNLPLGQRELQRLADQFNRDENLWRRLEPARRLRRKLLPRLSEKKHRALDVAQFSKAQPPREAIGRVATP